MLSSFQSMENMRGNKRQDGSKSHYLFRLNLYYNSSVIWFSVVIFSNSEILFGQLYQMLICSFRRLFYYLSFYRDHINGLFCSTIASATLLSFTMCLFFAEDSKVFIKINSSIISVHTGVT